MKKKRILFLCTGNSCRSQMAEGWAKHLKGDAIEAYSAGTEPEDIKPDTKTVMAEAGVDISGQRSKDVRELPDIPFDLVITLCDSARESCPVFPSKENRLGRAIPAASNGAFRPNKNRRFSLPKGASPLISRFLTLLWGSLRGENPLKFFTKNAHSFRSSPLQATGHSGIFRKTKMLHAGFEDPARLAGEARSEEEALSHYRRIRDEIEAFIREL